MVTCFISTRLPSPLLLSYHPHRFPFPDSQSPLSNPKIPVTIINRLLGPDKSSLWIYPHTYSKGVQFQSKMPKSHSSTQYPHIFLRILNLLQKSTFWIHPPPTAESLWLQASQVLTALRLTARRPPPLIRSAGSPFQASSSFLSSPTLFHCPGSFGRSYDLRPTPLSPSGPPRPFSR